jgi:DNA-binding transcriptional LysR family regulator
VAYRHDVELRHLRYFLAVAEELHFGRAAARLLIAGPSLSQQIKALEQQLHVDLFERSSAGVRLTDDGRALLPYARATVAAADELRTEAQRRVAGRSTRLRLGFQPFALTAAARELLAAFAHLHPEVELELRQYEWDDPSAGLLTKDVDIALVRTPFQHADRLRTVEVQTEAVVAVMRDGAPLSRLDSVSASQLAAEPFLETELVRDAIFAAYWYLRDLRPASATTVFGRSRTVEEWLGEIALGRGVSIIPATFAQDYARPGLAFVPVTGLAPSRIVLAWHPAPIHPAGQLLAALAAREAAKQGST